MARVGQKVAWFVYEAAQARQMLQLDLRVGGSSAYLS